MIDIQNALAQLQQVTTNAQADSWFDTYLGKKGQLNEEFKTLGSLSPEEKKNVGQVLSNAKTALTEAYDKLTQSLRIDAINIQLNQDIVDITIPAPEYDSGHLSLLTKTRREVEEICQNMGFIVEHGHDIVTKFENFASLNIPLSHPATEMHDTLYLDQKDPNGEALLLRTHTTALQNSLIKKYGVPLKVVMPGKVYRNESTDATHDTTFYQLDGIVIDQNITIGHMIFTMKKIIEALFAGTEVEIRTRPAYFPFVEPGIEMDARYKIVNEDGSTTYSKWIEIVGAWLIHPNVLKEANIDSTVYGGFAFGFGINRLVGVRHGIKDIRYFTNGDIRFAKSF
jgi:phenylalanyl-tRNA synthetase alpha chain